MLSQSSAGVIDESTMRAVLVPTPDTLINSSKSSRSFLVAKPYRAYASSRMASYTYSFTSFLPCMAVYVLSEMLSP